MKSAKISSNSATTTSSSSNAKLPLDWTCVARKRTKQSSVNSRDNRIFESTALTTNGGTSTNKDDESSKDIIPLTMDGVEEEYSCSCCPPVVADDEDDQVDNDIEGSNNEAAKETTIVVNKQGIGIFCLHDTDTTWFQGYFIPTDYNHNIKVKPIGILAVQREVDECIECADGGYRELDLTVYSSTNTMEPSGSKSKNTSALPPSSITVPVICTGGEMLRMRTMAKVSPTTTTINKDESDVSFQIKFDATTIYTGTKTIPYLKTYFASLVHKQRELLLLQAPMTTTKQDVTNMTELDLLPDCAIVCGNMVIRTTTTTTTIACP